jgi:enoyl-CoA hydratase/carnithine racemase
VSQQAVTYQCEDGIAIITLNREDKLNAFNLKMADQIIAHLDETDQDDAVKAVIFTGAGRAFCAGADLSGGGDTFSKASGGNDAKGADGSIDYSAESVRDIGGLVTLRIFDSKKPVIAAINGAAVGVGITMTLAMDIRLGSEHTKAGFIFAKRGIVPEAASSYFLPRIVGISKALEWCYSGKILKPTELHDAGLLNEIVPHEQLLARAKEIAQQFIQDCAPVSISLTRQMLWRGLGMSHPMEAHRVDSRAAAWRARSADIKEGVESFLEKRAPKFTDRVSRDMPDFYPWWDDEKYS